MTRFVIDAVTLLHLLDNDVRVHADHQLVAPGSIRSQALELLWRDVRSGDRSEAAALETHERLTELKMRLLNDRVSRGLAWRIVSEHGWETLREAEHVAITKLQADALVTVDPVLAARAEGIVPLAPLTALVSGD